MNKRTFLMLGLFILGFTVIKNSPVQAGLAQTSLSGWAEVTDHIDPGTCIRPDHLRICRDLSSLIQVETGDARLTGKVSIVFDSTATKAPYTERVKGDFRLDNGDGSWVGTWRGYTDERGHALFTAEGQGSGGYEGLVIRVQMERSSSNRWAPMSVTGMIDEVVSPVRRR